MRDGDGRSPGPGRGHGGRKGPRPGRRDHGAPGRPGRLDGPDGIDGPAARPERPGAAPRRPKRPEGAPGRPGSPNAREGGPRRPAGPDEADGADRRRPRTGEANGRARRPVRQSGPDAPRRQPRPDGVPSRAEGPDAGRPPRGDERARRTGRTARADGPPRPERGREPAGPAGPGRPGPRRPRGGGPRPPARPPAILRLGNPARRINIGLIGMAVVLSLFAGRLVQLQGLDAKVYEALAAEQRLQPEKLPARRGTITDVKGRPLAMTTEGREIYADPAAVPAQGRDRIAATLAKELGRPREEIAAKLAQAGRRYVVLARDATPDVAKKVLAHDFKGIGAKPQYGRLYPGDDLAGSLLGFVGDDGGGLSGIEAAYDKVLKGRDGRQSIEIGGDGRRIPMTRSSREPPVNGRDIRLTIDQDVQWAAQRAIAGQVAATGARSGSVIVMDVRTGDVLAMANAPELNLTRWRDAPASSHANRAVSEVFEPGSTNKVITAAAALESGAMRPETVLRVPDNIRCADRVIRDSHPHPVERYTFTGVLATSSNVGTIMAADRVGDRSLYESLRRFGFGATSGGGFPGEEAGLLPKWDAWSGSQRCTVAFGQGLSVTALQMTSVYQTIANGGVRVTPRIVAGTTDQEGNLVPAPPGKRTRVIAERTAKDLTTMLEAAVGEEGTGSLAGIKGYRVAGKTGTAERYDERCQGYCGYTATFVGFTPADAPRLVVLAVIQDPKKQYYGGQIAAPVFKDVMTFALKTKKIPPTGTTPPPVRIRAGE